MHCCSTLIARLPLYRDRPVSRQELGAGSLDIISFPMGNLLQREQGEESKTSFGISFKVHRCCAHMLQSAG